MKTNIIQSKSALALALFFAGVTAVTILKDVVIDGASFNLHHLQAVGAMVAAIAAGHFILPTIKQGRLPAAFGLFLVFASATGWIIVSAGARNAETAGVKALEVAARNQERASAREVLARAQDELAKKDAAATEAIRAAAAECGSGKGRKCEGKAATREAAKDDLAKAKEAELLARGQLSLLGPDERAYEGYHHASKVLEALGIGEAARTEAKLELLMPFALVLISELATLIFSAMAIGHGRKPDAKVIITHEPGPAATAPQPANDVEANTADRRGAVHSFVAAHVARHGKAPQIPAIQAMHAQKFGFALPKTTAWRWSKEAEESLAPVRHLRIMG